VKRGFVLGMATGAFIAAIVMAVLFDEDDD
jgi:hypothetical protein